MAEPAKLALQPEITLSFEEGSREEVLEKWLEETEGGGNEPGLRSGVELTELEPSNGHFTLILKNGERLKCRNVVLAFGVQGTLRKFGVPGQELPTSDTNSTIQQRSVADELSLSEPAMRVLKTRWPWLNKTTFQLSTEAMNFPKAKPKNRALIEAAIELGKISHYPNSRVKKIEEDHIILETPGGEVRVEATLVIGRLGAVPPRKFLESLKIEFPTPDRAAAPVISDRYESGVPGLYLIGAVAGYPLIKNCMNQGHEVVEHILGHPVTPADEPLLRSVLGNLEGSVDSILEEIQQKLPIFRNITRVQLREFLVDSTIHTPSEGEVIFERNDYSDSFYSILRGSVQIVVRSEAESNTDRPPGSATKEQRFFLSEGDFFGEMSLISGRRRSSTVIAGGQCVLIETPRLSMIRLKSSVPEVEKVIDEVFIRRKIQSGLAPDLSLEELHELAAQAVVETFKQGAELFHEGDPNNGLHLIRRGSVMVWRWKDQERQVLAYLPAGNVVGEMAFFAPDAKRNATVQATVLTETIRLPADTIIRFHELHPEIHLEQKKSANERLIENALRSSDRRAGGIVEFLMDAGAGEATDILLIDESLCARCDNCVKACGQTHGGVSRLDREAGPTFATLHIPTSCRHCENPKCMMDCPPDAIRRKPSGEVFIMDNCIGCGNCSVNCPYDVIQMAALEPTPPPNLFMRLFFGAEAAQKSASEDQKKLAVKCDLCSSLPAGPAATGGKRAACVESCPTGAILRVDPAGYVEHVMEESLKT